MRLDQESTNAFNTHIKSARFSQATKIISSDVQLTLTGPIVNIFDPGSGTYNVRLPPLQTGRFYVIMHTGVAGVLNVVDFLGAAIASLTPGVSTLLFGGDDTWNAVAGAAGGVFGPVGPSHSTGLVPDPGVGPASSPHKYLAETGVWETVAGLVASNSYFFTMKGGAVTLTPSGSEALEFLSADNKIVVLGQTGTTPKSIKFTLDQTKIDITALLNYNASAFVDHSTITLTAGLGISGGGTIAASRTFDFAPSELTTATPVLTDFAVWDLAATGPRKSTWTTVNGILDHNALVNYSATRHTDHATTNIVAGPGLTGGGDLTTSRTLSLNISGQTADTPAGADEIIFYDASQSELNKCTLTALSAVVGGGLSDAPSDGTLYGRKNAAWAEVVAQSYGGIQNYMFDTSTAAGPAAGRIRLNNATQTAATVMYFNYSTNDTVAVNLKTFFTTRVNVGDTFYLQDKDDISKWQLYRLNAIYTDNGTYASMPVTWLAGGSSLSAARIVVSREGASVASPIGEAPVDNESYARENAAWKRIPTITVASSAPGSPSTGDVWIDTT